MVEERWDGDGVTERERESGAVCSSELRLKTREKRVL